MLLKFLKCFAVIACVAVQAAPAQSSSGSYAAELSVPFGIVAGRLLTVGTALVFLDPEKPEMSFGVTRENLSSIAQKDGVLTIDLKQPVQDRSGSHAKLAFRLPDSNSAEAVVAWGKTGGSAETAEPSKPVSLTYPVQHDHLVGNCSGRLIITETQIAFESITDLDHSRRWTMKDIKELERNNPYSFKVVPFSGPKYSLNLQGSGMGSDEFKALVDRVTAARIR